MDERRPEEPDSRPPEEDLPERIDPFEAGEVEVPPSAEGSPEPADGGDPRETGSAEESPPRPGPLDSEPEPPVEQPTEEMFAFEARLRDEGEVPDLDPAVRAALLESDQPADSAQDPPAPPPQDPSGEPDSTAAGEDPGEYTGEHTAEYLAGTDEYQPPDSAEWDLPSEAAITAEETEVRAAEARNEVREAVEHARRTGRRWDPPRPPARGDFQEPGKRPRYWWRFLLATFIIVLAFGGATSASVLHVVNDIASKLEIPKKNRLPNWLVKDANGGPQTIAIIGSDARTGGGSPDGDPGRSDTTILLRLDPDAGQIAMLSIPRDLKVDIPGHGIDKFNAAYSYGGTKLTLKTIRQVTGLDINHVINVDFHGFAMLVDAVGCVFTDVDRKYYHSNEGVPPSEQYAEIDIEAGYQKLCGPDALEYARYRHTDTDLVRASRQQDLLSEVRNRLSFGEIIKRRDELIKAFTDNASSDISGGDQILELIRLLFDSRDARTVEVKFPATFTMVGGVSYVEATDQEIQGAVDKFLGFKESPGPIGTLKEGAGSRAASKKAQERKTKKKARRAVPEEVAKAPGKDRDGLADATANGMELASRIDSEFKIKDLPVMYPGRLPESTIFPEGSRAYHLRDTDKQPHKAYRMVMALEKEGLHYFGVQGIQGWQDPPILEAPHDDMTMAGRDFKVYSEGGRVKLVAWHERGNTYWISNSLLLTLTNDQMLGMARSTRAFTAGR